MTDEDDEKIDVKFKSYFTYYMNYLGGYKLIFTAQILMIMITISRIMGSYIIGDWSNELD